MMGELTYFLGFQVKQLKDGTFISQTKYTQDLLKRFGMKDAVGGLRLPKVLKNTTNMLSSIIYCHRKLRLCDEGVHGVKGVIWKKDEPILKLWMEKLRLSTRMTMKDKTDLKGKDYSALDRIPLS
jgi:hypothetical protein